MNCMHGCGAADAALNWTEQLDRLFGERATAISARRCAARTSLSPEWSITGDDQPKSPSCCDCGCAGATWRGTVCGNRENQPVEAVGLIWQGNHGWADPLRNGLNLATSIPYLRAHAVRIVMLECARRIDSDACSEGGRASDPSACMRRSHRRLNTLAWALADSSIEVHARLLATGLHVDDAAKLLLDRTISNLARLHGKFDAAFERFGGAGVPIVHVAYERLTQDYGTHIRYIGWAHLEWMGGRTPLTPRARSPQARLRSCSRSSACATSYSTRPPPRSAARARRSGRCPSATARSTAGTASRRSTASSTRAGSTTASRAATWSRAC